METWIVRVSNMDSEEETLVAVEARTRSRAHFTAQQAVGNKAGWEHMKINGSLQIPLSAQQAREEVSNALASPVRETT